MKRGEQTTSCLKCAVTVNRYIQVCLLHVFLHMQIYTEAELSYAYPQQQGKHTKAVNSNSTSTSHTHKKQNLKPKKQHKTAQ